MNSQGFLIIILIVSAAFAAWYLHSLKGGKKPTRLNMKAPDSAVPPLVLEVVKTGVSSQFPQESASEQSTSSKSSHPEYRDPLGAKNLNVLFNYNGHCWDAYEVLGVPAGAPIHLVTAAYQQAIKTHETQSLEFLEAAYQSILARK